MLLPGQERQSYLQACPHKPASAYSQAAAPFGLAAPQGGVFALGAARWQKKASRLAAGSLCGCASPDQWLMDSSERPRVAGPSRIMTMPTAIDTPMKAATPGTP